MNKLLIGLLVVAAGVGIFFLTRAKKENPVSTELTKELLIGKWTPAANDSGAGQFQYEFQDKGQLVRSAGDSIKADTSHYAWNKNNELVWKQDGTDSVGKSFTVLKLSADSLEVKAQDSVITLFTRVK